jgi:hypothetical protein
MQTLLMIAATALLSSLLTLALVAWWLRRRLLPESEQRLNALLAAKGEELGAEIEERVRRGARQGIAEGLSSLSSPERLAEGLQGASQSVGRAARNLVGSGLSGLMGGGRKPPPEER